MKYIIALILVLDSSFQLWAEPQAVEWHIFYDLMHNVSYFLLSIWSLNFINKIKHIAIPAIIYFSARILLTLSYIGMTKSEMNSEISESNPFYLWSFFALFLLIIVYFLLNKSLKIKWHEWKK